MKVVGYVRISDPRKGQTTDMQRDELVSYCQRQGWALETIYEDQQSGGDAQSRPQFQQLMRAAGQRRFDTVVVWKIDRFARSLVDFVTTVQELDRRGIRFVAITQGIDTDKSNPASRLQMNMLAAFAEFERSLISERVKAGIERARREGRKFGRKPAVIDESALRSAAKANLAIREMETLFGVSRMTLYRRLKGLGLMATA